MRTDINPDDYILENFNTMKLPDEVSKEYSMNIKEDEVNNEDEKIKSTKFPSLAKEGYKTAKASHNFKFSHLKQ
jgi:hypothetical protein